MTTTPSTPATPSTAAPPSTPAPPPVASPPRAEARPKPAPRGLGLFTRFVLIVAGGALVVGFFLPWLTVTGVASISGFGLMVADGQAVEMVSGSHRFLLFAVPLFGVALLMGGVTGHRAGAWLALIAGLAVIGDGLVTLIALFLNTTGTGMWMVIGGAFAALITGLLTVRRSDD